MKIQKSLLTIIIFALIFASFPATGVNAAVQIIPQTHFAFSKAQTPQNQAFGPATSIVVVPLKIADRNFVSDDDWYRAIYYYQSFRLNQGDMLFHYVLTRDGRVLQGTTNGEDHRFDVRESEDKPVIIAYLSGDEEIDFAKNARPVLSELLLEIANRNALPLDKILVRDIEFVAKPNETVFSRLRITGGRWDLTIKDIVKEITPRYNPQSKVFTFAVEKVELPTGEVNYGDSVVANITIKNTSQYIFYKGIAEEPIVSKVEPGESKFFLNDVWLSTTQAPLVIENTIMKPGDTARFSLRLNVPLYFGEQSENFQLASTVGQVYPGTEFKITLNIKHPDKEVVEITPTETGQLNVRESPSGFSPVSSRVTPGQRFFVLERNDGGWVKLDLGDGNSGWVVSKYTKVV